jgi:hypothetical protein
MDSTAQTAATATASAIQDKRTEPGAAYKDAEGWPVNRHGADSLFVHISIKTQ